MIHIHTSVCRDSNQHTKVEMYQEFFPQMEINRKWKRYIIKMKREGEEEKTVSASDVVTTTVTTAGIISSTTTTTAEVADTNEEIERKKRFKMRTLLHTFMKKQVMRDAIIFSLLTDYSDVFYDDDTNKETNKLFHMLRMLRTEEEE